MILTTRVITIFFVNLFLLLPAEAQESKIKTEEIRTITVVLSGLIEAYSIYHFNAPIPYLGVGHFYHKSWVNGSIYWGTELGLKLLENHYQNSFTRDFTTFPNQTSESIYFPTGARGYSPSAFRKKSYAEQLDQNFYYLRLIDFFDFYRKTHSKSQNEISLRQESIPSLILSPFKWKHIKNPWIYVPATLGGIVTYLSVNSTQTISDAKAVGILGGNYKATQAVLSESNIQLQRQMIVSAGEEMYFRGVLQTELAEHTNPNTAIFLSALLFGAWHIPNNGIGNGISAGLGGLFFGYRYKKSGYDLGQPIAQHFWINFFARNAEFFRNPKSGQFVYSIMWKF